MSKTRPLIELVSKGFQFLTHLRSAEHGGAKVDGPAGLEVELELGLAHKVAVGLGSNLALDVIRPENGLLQLHLKKKVK